MSDEFSDESDSAELSRLLDNAAIWTEPSAPIEDMVIAAITAERAEPAKTSQAAPGDEPVVDLGEHRARRAGGRRFWPLAAAAALLIVAISAAAGFTYGQLNRAELTTVALAPTDLAPGSSAVVRIDERPNGARLMVDLSGLKPAPLGYFYEVWLVKDGPSTAISAGTFHMRGSESGEIEFWAGVSAKVYRTVTVTLESEAAPSAPGELIMEGQVGAS